MTAPFSQTSTWPGRQLPDVAEDRVRRRDRVEGEERLERVEVDLAARQRPQLRREAQLVADVPVVERLDPVAVAREHEPAARRVPDRDGEHPAQPLGEAERRAPRRGGRAPRCRSACAARARRARARGEAPGSCRSRRSGRRRSFRPRSRSAGRRAARSMIERRRAARAIPPSTCSPALSGPRWTSRSLIARSASTSACAVRRRDPADPAHGAYLRRGGRSSPPTDCLSTRQPVAKTVRR